MIVWQSWGITELRSAGGQALSHPRAGLILRLCALIKLRRLQINYILMLDCLPSTLEKIPRNAPQFRGMHLEPKVSLRRP